MSRHAAVKEQLYASLHAVDQLVQLETSFTGNHSGLLVDNERDPVVWPHREDGQQPPELDQAEH